MNAWRTQARIACSTLKETSVRTSPLRSTVRLLLHRTLLTPASVRHCSQTIYEALLGCSRMWQATGHPKWQERTARLSSVLRNIQRADGGFDIGYDFNFGRLHKKGDSTAPELVGLIAYCESANATDNDQVEPNARRAAEWIRRFARRVGPEAWAIPYSPYTTSQIMVYNGTSFACGALGRYLGQFGEDPELRKIYLGMIRYLDDSMTQAPGLPGRYWHYNDQSRQDLSVLARAKIDYYHQMQQVEVHSLAQQMSPVDRQARMIRDAADHIISLHDRYGSPLPYTNRDEYFKGHIHVWGLSSVAAGLIEAASALPERRSIYERVARETIHWILQNAWTGDHFAAATSRSGVRIEPDWYMVRSDAWVFSALGAAAKAFPDLEVEEIAEKCYSRMEAVDFSGPESHATNIRLRVVGSALRAAKFLLKRA